MRKADGSIMVKQFRDKFYPKEEKEIINEEMSVEDDE